MGLGPFNAEASVFVGAVPIEPDDVGAIPIAPLAAGAVPSADPAGAAPGEAGDDPLGPMLGEAALDAPMTDPEVPEAAVVPCAEATIGANPAIGGSIPAAAPETPIVPCTREASAMAATGAPESAGADPAARTPGSDPRLA